MNVCHYDENQEKCVRSPVSYICSYLFSQFHIRKQFRFSTEIRGPQIPAINLITGQNSRAVKHDRSVHLIHSDGITNKQTLLKSQCLSRYTENDWYQYSSSEIHAVSGICRMTNYELLHWLVETLSRDVHHYRIMNMLAVDRVTLQCCIVTWPCDHVTLQCRTVMWCNIAMSHGHVMRHCNVARSRDHASLQVSLTDQR